MTRSLKNVRRISSASAVKQPIPIDPMLVDETDEWRHTNIGRLLNNAARRFETRVFELLAATGHTEARLTHLNLTRNLDMTGTRMTELARRAGVTKQAMAELIVQCEQLDLIRRVADSTDARAKVVKFTKRGLEWLEAFRASLAQAENEMRQELGTLCVDGLKSALSSYAGAYHSLDLAHPDTPESRRLNQRTRRNHT